MNTSSASRGGSFVTGNRKFEESHVGTENKKGFLGSCLVKPIKNAARYIADGICTVFRGIRSFLISVCSPFGSCFRGARGADPVRHGISSRQVEPHEQPAFAEPVFQDNNEYLGTLPPGNVTLVSNRQGIAGFIKSQTLEGRYAVVNSIDGPGKLQQGVGRAIRELAGEDYARATRVMQGESDPGKRAAYGTCATYVPAGKGKEGPAIAGDKNWQAIHNVLAPVTNDSRFQGSLRGSLYSVLLASATTGTKYIVLPLLGCGRAGGTGAQLAKALFNAMSKIKVQYPHYSLPEVMLVGTDSPADRQALADFKSEWVEEVNQQEVSRRPVTEPTPLSWTHQPDESTSSGISSGAVANPAPLPSGVTLAASPSVSLPASAHVAGTDAVTWEDTGPAFQDSAALDEAAPDVRSPSARPVAQEADWPSEVIPAVSPLVSMPASALSAETDAMTREDTGPVLQGGAALDEAAPNVRPPSVRPVAQEVSETETARWVTTLKSKTGSSVKLVHTDMRTFVAEQERESKKGDGFTYGVVSPVNETGQLQGAVKDLVDREVLLPAQCGQYLSYKPGHANGSGLDNLRIVFGAQLYHITDPAFDQKLTENIRDVLFQAAQEDIDRVFLPLWWDCDRNAEIGGPSSGRVAEALNTALYEFRNRYGSKRAAPQVFLTGMGNDLDYPAFQDFEDAWRACEQDRADRAARTKARRAKPVNPGVRPSAIAGAAATGADHEDQAKVLIDGQLEVAMCADNGMFGYGKKLSSEGKAFDLVNAANENMNHVSGIAGQFADDLGEKFRAGTKAKAGDLPGGTVPAGQCITTESYDYASNSRFGLTGCRYIHSVVAPDTRRTLPEEHKEYRDRFKDAFVSLLLAADERGSDTVVSCFIGCATFGGDGNSMARALYDAYKDDRIKRLPKVPRLVLVGWNSPRANDWRVYRDFVWTFEQLNDQDPIKLPSRG